MPPARTTIARLRRTIAACALAACATWLGASVAQADSEVVIYVSGAGEGITVVLTDVAGAVHTCRTDATGSCEINGATPGRATVVTQASGASSSPRTVMIAEGKVSVFVPGP